MEYVNNICKVGQGKDCCRYLAADKYGFCCLKLDEKAKKHIDNHVEYMSAKADNCEGKEVLYDNCDS
jgi:hypothetical protein